MPSIVQPNYCCHSMLSGLIRYLQSGSALWFLGLSNLHMERRLAGQALILHQTIGYLVCGYLYLRVVKAAGQTARNHPGRIEFWQCA